MALGTLTPLYSLVLSSLNCLLCQGYFTCDKDTTADLMVFNRTLSLKDSYTKGKQEGAVWQ